MVCCMSSGPGGQTLWLGLDVVSPGWCSDGSGPCVANAFVGGSEDRPCASIGGGLGTGEQQDLGENPPTLDRQSGGV